MYKIGIKVYIIIFVFYGLAIIHGLRFLMWPVVFGHKTTYE